MSAASILAQLAPMAAPSGDALSAGAMAAENAGVVFAGLMAAEALSSSEADEPPAAEGPVEASAVDASQPLVSSALLMAIQPRPQPVPVITAESGDAATTEAGVSPVEAAAEFLGLQASEALEVASAPPAPSQAPSSSLAAVGSERAASAGPTLADPQVLADLDVQVSSPLETRSSPIDVRSEADRDAQVAKALAAAAQTTATPAPQTSSNAALAAAALAAVGNRPARTDSAAVSNASAERSAENQVSEGDSAASAATPGGKRPTAPAANGQAAAASHPAQPGASGTPAGASPAPQPTTLAASLNPDSVLDGSAPASTSGGSPAPAALPTAAPPPSVNTTTFSQLAQSTLDTTIHLAAQITRRLEGRATRFEMGLTPEGLGRVDVKLDIDAGGRLTARLAFDNPLAATELRGRADELRRELQAQGFEIAQDGLEFSDRQSSSSGQGFDQRQSRAFSGAARLNAEADLAQPVPATWMSLNLTPRGVDMKV